MDSPVEHGQVVELKKKFYSLVRDNRKMACFFSRKSTLRLRYLTRSLNMLKKKWRFLFFMSSSIFLLLKSQMCTSIVDAKFLLENGFVAQNGVTTKMQEYLCRSATARFFSVTLHKNFFFLYFTFLNKISWLKAKLGTKQSKLQLARTNIYKQKPTHFSRKFTLYSHVHESIPAYLEVDFFTLSFFVLNQNYDWTVGAEYISMRAARSYSWTVTT